MNNGKIGIGMAGCGYWGPNLVRVFSGFDSCEVKSICDTRQEKLDAISKEYRRIRFTTDYNDLLERKDIDAVVISTPASTHYALAKEALVRGKHVFVEKPMAGSSNQAEELIEIAERKKRTFIIGHTFLYSPPVLKIKELIQKGATGKVYYIDSSRLNPGPIRSDAPVIWDLGSHDVSMILYWLNDFPKEASATGYSYMRKDMEEVAFITLRFASGVTAHMHVSWFAPCKLRRTAIAGSNGMIVYNDMEKAGQVKIYGNGYAGRQSGAVGHQEISGSCSPAAASGAGSADAAFASVSSMEPLKIECMDFISSIQSGNEPKSNARFGLKIVKVLEAAQKSLKNHGAWIAAK